MLTLGLQVGIEQRFIALAAPPENIVRPAQFQRGIHVRLHIRGGIGIDIRIGICRRTRHPAPVAEHIGGAPQKLCLVAGLLLAKVVDDFLKVAQRFREGGAFGAGVGVVEAVEGRAQDIEHLEGHIGLQLGKLHRVAEPRAIERLSTERIATRPSEAVPVGDGEPQVIFHALAEDDLVGIVMPEGKFVGARRPLILDLGDALEKLGHVSPRIADCAAR